MRASQLPPEALRTESVYRQTGYWLVAAMMACASLTASQLILKALPTWPVLTFMLISVLVSLERQYSYHSFTRISLLTSDWLKAFGAQWVLILVALRLMLAFSGGMAGFLADLSALGNNFIDQFFRPEYIAAIVLTIANWISSGYFADLIGEMGLTQGLVALEEDFAAPRNTLPARIRLMNLVLGQGIVLVILTAILRVNLRAFFNSGEPVLSIINTSTGSLSTLAYFMLGLALLGQGQFMSLHTQWSYQRIHIPTAMAARWAAYGLAFLLLLMGLASLLPTSFSLGFFSVMGSLLQGLMAFIFYLMQFLLFGFASLLGLILSIFGIKQPAPTIEPTPPPAPELFPTPESMAPTGNPWLDLVKSAFTWGLLIALIGFALLQFIRQHAGLASALEKVLQNLRLGTLWKLLHGLFTSARELSHSATEGLRQLLGRFSTPARSGFNFLNPRRLDTRQRITFYYLALIRRGGERGLPRKPSQTPAEYAAALDPALPEVQAEIDALTETFVAARYSPRPVEAPQVARAHSLWERIRKALRPKGK